ncbi:MAG: hypothetical protein K5989_04820 [Lachnospiraceae bacterium]|nr:hypothetical protein [Lachnospiraceae bacterium]
MSEELKSEEMQGQAANGGSESNEAALLRELIDLQKKEARHSRVVSILMLLVLVFFVVVAVIVLPKVLITLGEANTAIIQGQQALTRVDEEMDNISEMTKSITKTSNGVNDMLETNMESVSSAVKQIGSIDFEGLNSAIGDLQNAVKSLSSFLPF